MAERLRLKPEVVRTDRVCDVANEQMTGRVVKQGPQQSEVVWDNGRTQYVSNDWIKNVRE